MVHLALVPHVCGCVPFSKHFNNLRRGNALSYELDVGNDVPLCLVTL